ncbi:MAG: hypothetical protein MZW92_16005 [Comamonadaceae bacterium]|nr:hypothetical protein [Comamonadaceae bacterium]
MLGVMSATAFVSMWVSNTSTTLMMLPVAVSIAALVAPDPGPGGPASGATSRPPSCWLWRTRQRSAASRTLIGTPTNALAVAFMEQTYGVRPELRRVAGVRRAVHGPDAGRRVVGARGRGPTRSSLPDIARARDVIRAELGGLGPLTRSRATRGRDRRGSGRRVDHLAVAQGRARAGRAERHGNCHAGRA